MYAGAILPLLTYNIGSLGLCATDMEKLNTTHRHHLRLIYRIHYPTININERLYKTCNSAGAHQHLRTQQRWRLFGHVLRLPKRSRHRQPSGPTTTRRDYSRSTIKTALPSLLENDLAYIGEHLRTLETWRDCATWHETKRSGARRSRQ